MGGCAVSVSTFGASAVEILEHLTVVSSGIATLGVIDEVVRAFRNVKDTDLALLACTSSYPAPPEEMHLRRIPHLAETFDMVPGLSDHTLGTEVPVAVVALGARIVEKHLTFSRDKEGPDSDFSFECANSRGELCSTVLNQFGGYARLKGTQLVVDRRRGHVDLF